MYHNKRMIGIICLSVLVSVFVLISPLLATGAGLFSRITPSRLQAGTITVAGTVTGPAGPVSGVWVGVGAPEVWRETTTDASGRYSVSIQTDGELWIHVRPDVASRLTQANVWMNGITADVTQNFTVTNGYLLSPRPVGSDGAPIAGDLWLDVQPLQNPLFGTESYNQWYSLDWDDVTQRHQAVLPPDVYYVTVRHPPAGYFDTTQAFDLRTSDAEADLPLNTSYVHPIPYDPPDAGKISISAVDGLGEATITGAAGAALPLAHVLLVNLNSTHQAHTTSEADGSFSASIYAPPGSAIMIKHGPPDEWRWHALDVGVAEGVNPYPGTIVNVPHTHTAGQTELPFAAAGGLDIHADDPADTRNYVGAA
ncbi:MAG: hypothetical protein MAG451_00540 [Anaerolineales bacterium]|nr:hypothetical protein [Anaerolineales bacterium]